MSASDTTVICAKCGGDGFLAEVPGYPQSHIRIMQPGDGFLKWVPCPTCKGAGVLPTYRRSPVWELFPDESLRDEELRFKGSLGDDCVH